MLGGEQAEERWTIAANAVGHSARCTSLRTGPGSGRARPPLLASVHRHMLLRRAFKRAQTEAGRAAKEDSRLHERVCVSRVVFVSRILHDEPQRPSTSITTPVERQPNLPLARDRRVN